MSVRFLLAVSLGVCALTMRADDSSNPVTDEAPLVLTPFTVSTKTAAGRYQASEATSGGRIALDLSDSMQSVAVVTRELIEDAGALRVLDATKFAVSSVTESTIPNGLDRITIRGFQTDGQTVDGFYSIGQANLDPVAIERIEVVKGPNAILAPSGVPGGTINNVTRKPLFRNSTTLSAEIGLFDSQRMELDVNRKVDAAGRFAFRVVSAVQSTDGFASDHKRAFIVMPMLAYRSPRGTDITLQAAFTDWRAQNYLGMPIDPSSGTKNEAKLIAGVPRDLNINGDDFRRERRPEFRALLTTPLTESLSMRLAARYTQFDADFEQSPPGGATGGSRDPLTGDYVGGLSFATTSPFASTPVVQSRTMPRGGTYQTNHRTYANFQNDYVWKWKNAAVNTTTLVGGASNYYRQDSRDIPTTKAAINFDAVVPANYVLGATASNRQNTVNYDQQLYLTQSASFFRERLILNAGYSYNNYDLAVDDLRTNTKYRVSLDKELRSYGAVVKPFPGASLYFGHSENAQPLPANNIAAGNPPLQEGSQDEYGVRFETANKRIGVSVAHFEITQNNFAVPNPGNLVVPPPVPPLPFLLSDRLAKGWELEFHASLAHGLSVVGNVSAYRNRDPNNVPFRGNAEHSWAVNANYQFPRTSPFKHLNLSLGANWLSSRPGDQGSGVTAASTSAQIIPNQPSFYLPARTLIDFSSSYRLTEHCRVQLSVSNLLNEKYLAASLSRFLVFSGAPVNARLKVTYSF